MRLRGSENPEEQRNKRTCKRMRENDRVRLRIGVPRDNVVADPLTHTRVLHLRYARPCNLPQVPGDDKGLPTCQSEEAECGAVQNAHTGRGANAESGVRAA
eukprot:scaffold92108_cov30-Tisochrysis_lutea.AAC.2